jgi:elongation factor G
MDKEHASYAESLKSLREVFGDKFVPAQIAIGDAESFKGVADVFRQKAYMFQGDGKVESSAVPDDMTEMVQNAREKMMEEAAETDDELLETFFDQATLEENDLQRGLRAAIASASIYPVVCTASPANMGVQQVMDFIAEMMPSPADVPAQKAWKPGDDLEGEPTTDLPADPSQPPAAMVFKTVIEPHIGELSVFRVFTGTVKAGSEMLNSSKREIERMGQLFALTGNQRKEVADLGPGEIGAAVKLRVTDTGDTLCGKNNELILPPIAFPKPVLSMAAIVSSKGDEDRISNALTKLKEEDATVEVAFDPDLKQTIVSGMGELHFNVITAKLKTRYNVDVEWGKPKVPYRETIRGKSEAQGKFKKQTGGRGQYGDVWLRLEPRERGEGFEFVDEVVGGAIPSKFIPAVEKGVVEAMSKGIIANYQVQDVRATVYDGGFHPVDSSEVAFKVAASMAFKKAAENARPVLLEPIYNLKVLVPEEFMGDVMSDLNSKRGRILGMDQEGNFQVIRAEVPLAELYKYSTQLRSLTQGRGVCEGEFARYEEVPGDLQEKIKQEAMQEQESS